MPSLHQIFYTSVSSAPLGPVGLSELLMQARENNQSLDITGILTYHKRRFMQLLEGDEHRISDLYEAIAEDPRHHSIELLYSGSIKERSFGKWSMGYFNLGDYSVDEIANFEQFVESRMTALRTSQEGSYATEIYDMLTKMMLGSGGA